MYPFTSISVIFCLNVLTTGFLLTLWRNQMEAFSALLAFCAGNSPVTSEFPSHRLVSGAWMFSLICAWINSWVNNREAGDLRRHCAHYDVTVMTLQSRCYARCVQMHTYTAIKHAIPDCSVLHLIYWSRDFMISYWIRNTWHVRSSLPFEAELGKNVSVN